jgi:hypothetical protein
MPLENRLEGNVNEDSNNDNSKSVENWLVWGKLINLPSHTISDTSAAFVPQSICHLFQWLV